MAFLCVLGCDEAPTDGPAPTPSATVDPAPGRPEPEPPPIIPDLPEVPDLAADQRERRPLALLNEAFVSEAPPTPTGFERYAHARSCKDIAPNLLLERFTVDVPEGMDSSPCGDGQSHSYALLHTDADGRARQIALGAANGNPPPEMIDRVMAPIASQLGGEVEPHDAAPLVVHGSELSVRDYTMSIPADAARMPGRWAVRAVVVPKPWVRDETGTVRMGGPIPGLLVLWYEPLPDDADLATALEPATPAIQTLLESVRFAR